MFSNNFKGSDVARVDHIPGLEVGMQLKGFGKCPAGLNMAGWSWAWLCYCWSILNQPNHNKASQSRLNYVYISTPQ